MGFVNGDKVQAVIVAKLDQLTRDLMIQEHIIADLHRRGLKLVSALCLIDPRGCVRLWALLPSTTYP
jgi:DNA invertase Pin-like site-specific DNA recombinase